MNIQAIQKTIILFITKYKIAIGILLILTYFIFSIILLNIRTPLGDEQIPDNPIQPTAIPQQQNTSTELPELGSDADSEINLYADNAQEQQTLPDGSVKYTLPTEGGTRNSVVIMKSDGNGVLFQRSVIDQRYPIKLSEYLQSFGQPEQIRAGHPYYGDRAQIYIYSTKGLAYVVNTSSEDVLELHTFSPMTIEEYLSIFAEEI